MATSEVSFDSKHEDHITDLQWDFYARRLATASSDRTVKIFKVVDDGASHEHQATLTGHDGPVWECAWAHPSWGSVVASCSYDGKVLIYREDDASKRWSLVHEWSSRDESPCSVNGIEFAPVEHGALMLACASSDGFVTILLHHADQQDLWTSHRFAASRLGCNAVSWGPAGAIGALLPGHQEDASSGAMAIASEPLRLVTGSCDNKVKFWRATPPPAAEGGLSALASGDVDLTWTEEPAVNDGKLHTEWVRDVAWAPFAGVPAAVAASCSEDKAVYVWEKTRADEPWTPKLVHKFDEPVWRCSWSVFGTILAVSSGDSDVSMWKEDVKKSWHKLGPNDPPAATPAPGGSGPPPPAASE